MLKWMLNPDSPIPLYRQAADALLHEIRQGDYPIGSRIPSEHHLAERFGIGRPTVRQATDVLIRRRLLTRRRGAGTFVCGPPPEVDLFSLVGTTASFAEKGLQLETEYLEKLHESEISDTAENPFAGGQAYFVSRVSRVDSSPVLLEEIYLDTELFRGIDRFDLRGSSLSRIVAERYFLQPQNSHQSFRVDAIQAPRARVLELEVGAAVLAVRRWLQFPGASNGVYADLFCRTDRFAFSQNIGGPSASGGNGDV